MTDEATPRLVAGSGMAERMARRIYEKRNGAGRTPWSRLPKSHQEPYRSDARAALTALLEPDEGMVEAGARGLNPVAFWSVDDELDHKNTLYKVGREGQIREWAEAAVSGRERDRVAAARTVESAIKAVIQAALVEGE